MGLPYVLIARKEIKTIQDLRGKTIGVGTVAGMPYRLLKMFEKKFNLQDIQIRPVGGSQPERYSALLQGIIQAAPFTSPMDARGKKDGFNVLYQFSDLGLPALYSSLHISSKSLRERRDLVQKMVAAFAEAVRFVEDNPDKAKASVSKVLRLKDEDALQASYDAYAKRLINRRMIVPVNSVTEGVEIVRESGTKVIKKATELLDNSFAENLERAGFSKRFGEEGCPRSPVSLWSRDSCYKKQRVVTNVICPAGFLFPFDGGRLRWGRYAKSDRPDSRPL